MIRLVVSLCLTAMVSSYSFEATNSAYLDPSHTVLFEWAYTEDTIKFEVTMPTIGWMGIGFSPSGEMIGADIILAWMKEAGEPRVLDMHANSNGVPMLDVEQDILEYGLKQNGTHTTLFIERYLDTCDKLDDFVITVRDVSVDSGSNDTVVSATRSEEDTTRVIYAYNDNAPVGDLPTAANYHGSGQRNVKSLRLLDRKLPVLHVEEGGDIKYFDIRIKPFTIPQKKTYYHCTYHKLPEFQQKQHAVQFEILKTPGNEKNLHHIVVYHCNESLVTEEMLNSSHTCYEEDDESHWKYCSPVVVAWAVGMTEITFPEHVGYPLGTTTAPKIVKFEIHFDNTALEEGIVDTSGLRVFHTSKLRKYDAGVLMTGHDVSPALFIPPGSKDFIVHGHCTSQCLEGILEYGGESSIHVFGVVLHSHTAGRRMVLRHYRNGTELKPLAKDLTYDFNFQETKLLANEVTVQSGDNLIMECVYNTVGRTTPTLGGLGTEYEMCLGFVMYYPKLADAYCQTSLSDLMEYFGVTNFQGVYTAAIEKNWTEYSRQQFNQVELSSPRFELCRTMSGPITGLQEPYNIPSVEHVYEETSGRCEAEKQEQNDDCIDDRQKKPEDCEDDPTCHSCKESTSDGVITRMSTTMLGAMTMLSVYLVSNLVYCNFV